MKAAARRCVVTMGRRSMSSSSKAAPVNRCFSAEVLSNGRALSLKDSNGEERVVHPLWLRERTLNPAVMHFESKQRLFEVAEYLDGPQGRIVEGFVDAHGDLCLTYGDGFSDVLDPLAIVMELKDPYTVRRVAGEDLQPVSLALPEMKYWGDEFNGRFSLPMVTYDYEEVARSDAGLNKFLASLLTWGVGVVKNTPGRTEPYKNFLRSMGLIRQTNWGSWFEVAAKVNAGDEEGASYVDTAYSNLGIPLHTDGPYNLNPLLYQVLQCLKQSNKGGDSTLSDGFGAARALQKNDPEAFRILSTTSVRFYYSDSNNELLTNRPIIGVDADGEIQSVRFSGRLDGTPAFESMTDADAFYRAKLKFIQELYRSDRLLSFKLSEGDMLIFSNTRILHGRSEFSVIDEPLSVPIQTSTIAARLKEEAAEDGLDLSKVSRYLRGCYLDSVSNKYRVTARRLATGHR